ERSPLPLYVGRPARGRIDSIMRGSRFVASGEVILLQSLSDSVLFEPSPFATRSNGTPRMPATSTRSGVRPPLENKGFGEPMILPAAWGPGTILFVNAST